MAITIKKVSTQKELKTFIRFNYELYKDNPYSVPDLYDDMLNTFSPKKNAAFEFCEARRPKNLVVIGANKDIELYPRKTSKPDASFRLKLSDILTNRCIESG